MTNRIYMFLGLATRAGKLVSGDETCERMIRTGKAVLVIVSEDASPNTLKKFSDMCGFREIDLRIYGKKDLIGLYTGKDKRSVAAILDMGFAGRLMQLIDECRK